MTDHFTADCRRHESEQDRLDRLINSMSDADKEQIAQDMIADYLDDDSQDEECLCYELSISASDAQEMIALNKHNRGAWLGIMIQRAKTFWEEQILDIYIEDNKG